jgi:release factor glutamine methyltransferase
MRITTNTIHSVINFYKEELATLYSESELQNVTNWILEKQLNVTASQVISNPGFRINESDLTRLEQMCFELKKNKPYQYVLGAAEFYKLKFKVNEHVLIPRPETEELVELIISKHRQLANSTSILDIGTGSGCIPVTLKKNIPAANVYAMDISEEALDIARFNAKENKTGIIFFKADVLVKECADEIIKQTGGKKINILVSNPPYVLSSEKDGLHERVKNYEPALALFVNDPDPIFFYRKIALLAKQILEKNGCVYFECHADFAASVQEMLLALRWQKVLIYTDLSGSARFVEACMTE